MLDDIDQKLRFRFTLLMKTKLSILIIVLVPLISFGQQETKTLAHWKFDPKHKESGTIKDGDLILKDISGNENNLAFKVLKNNGDYGEEIVPENLTTEQKEQLVLAFEWQTGSYGNDKNLLFKKGGSKEFWDLSGYFQTVETAPINSETFLNGYTIEITFKLPKNFTLEKHKWIALLNRHGSATQLAQKTGKEYVGIDANQTISSLNISNLRELQWTYYSNKPTVTSGATENPFYENETNWSFTLDDNDSWYHIVLINDGKQSEIYVNGVTDFRNADPTVYPANGGIANTISSKFGWDIGARGNAFDNGVGEDNISDYNINKTFEGQIQEVRFTRGALSKDKWLYADISQKNHTSIGTNEDIPLLTNSDNYNIVFVPDTQKPARYMPEIVDEQMKWIANNTEANNIVFTNFLGDLVDRFREKYEWDNVLRSLDYLKQKDVRFLTVDGNHDSDGESVGESEIKAYPDYFGAKYYEGKDYYFNDSPSGFSAYSIIRGGNYTYLFISTSFFQTPYLKDLKWINNVIKQYSYLPVVFSTHRHLYFKEDGSGVNRVDDENYKKHSKNGSTKEMLFPDFHFSWERIIAGNNNVFMTMSGHNHGAGYQIVKNELGNNVFEGVFDYQSSYHGGNGWMNFAEFDEANNEINFKVFSPWVALIPDSEKAFYDVKHLTRPEEMFTYNINFKERFDFYPNLKIDQKRSRVNVDYKLKETIPNSYIAIFKEGEEAKEGNIFARKEISSNEDVVEFKLPEGGYYATLMVEGLYVQVSNDEHFIIKRN